MPLTEAARIPRATYRVQLQPAFGFRELEALVPYLQSLGLSDLYLSPIFTAGPGSTHGYDVNDYNSISPDLGGPENFQRLTDFIRRADLGILLDMVPNHMGVMSPRNAWWRDVLECGRLSAYAPFFDIQWSAAGEQNDCVLVPLLGDFYGKLLEAGEIKLACEGGFFLRYHEASLPLQSDSQARLIRLLAEAKSLSDELRAAARRRARLGRTVFRSAKI